MPAIKRKKKGLPESPSKKAAVAAAVRNLELPEGYQPQVSTKSSHGMALRGQPAKGSNIHPMALRAREDKRQLQNVATTKNGTSRYDRSKFKSDVNEWLNQPRPRTSSPPRNTIRKKPSFTWDPKWSPYDSYRRAVRAWKTKRTVRRYGMVHSRTVLAKRGFRPEVSSRAPEKHVVDWLKTAESQAFSKPTREDFIKGTQKAFGGQIVSQSRQITRVSCLLSIPCFFFVLTAPGANAAPIQPHARELR
jgi:hypothetical protein